MKKKKVLLIMIAAFAVILCAFGAYAAEIDTDNDGTPDYLDQDSDNDGILDQNEWSGDKLNPWNDLDQDGIWNFRDLDSDGDTFLDADEVANGTDPYDASSPGAIGEGEGEIGEGEGEIGEGEGEIDPDVDGDGINDIEEDGAPNGGDGNLDGQLDSLQPYVTSLFDGGNSSEYVTIVAPEVTSLFDVSPLSVADLPPYSFPVGLFNFTVDGLIVGETIEVDLIIHSQVEVNSYVKQHGTPGNKTYQEFLYDGDTGAAINGHTITVTLTDGASCDEDGAANGQITDPSGPAIFTEDPGPQMPVGCGSGGVGIEGAMILLSGLLYARRLYLPQ